MSDSRNPITEEGGRLARQSLSRPVRIDQILGIETEAWNAALAAVEEAVGGMNATRAPGASGGYVELIVRGAVLSRIAALRKPSLTS